MKQFTKKFLRKGTLGDVMSEENITYNAKKAFEEIEIPEKLWLELSDKFPESKLGQDLANNSSTFMAGFIIGWVEKSRKIK